MGASCSSPNTAASKTIKHPAIRVYVSVDVMTQNYSLSICRAYNSTAILIANCIFKVNNMFVRVTVIAIFDIITLIKEFRMCLKQ